MDMHLMANEVLLECDDRSLQSTRDKEMADEMQDGPELFNYHVSFGVMTGRRLQRRYRGVYRKYSFWIQVLTCLIVLYIIVALAVLAITNSDAPLALDTSSNISLSDGLFYFVLLLLAIYLLVKLALLIRWILYWILLAEIFTSALTGKVYVLFWLSDADVTARDRRVRLAMLVTLGSVELVTILAYAFTHYAYPWLVRHQKFNLTSWWTIAPGTATHTLTYRSRARFYTRTRDVIQYCGGLNAAHQPHGFGIWTDTNEHGEQLTGEWAHGVPIGPFRSFEHGSGYSFVNLRIAYCHNRAEVDPQAIAWCPRHSSTGVHWGVASVECSVSGGFFRYLPTGTHLTRMDDDADAPRNATECLTLLRTPTDTLVFSGGGGRTMMADDAMATTHDHEALVLLPGYNCSLEYGLHRLAQLVALGDFPSWIHPFVFSWPSGSVLAYFQAKAVGSESARTAHDFVAFLQSLRDAGYTKVNLIAHSMGARVFFSALKRGVLDDVFQVRGSGSTRPLHALELATLTLCNPDYELTAFVQRGGGYDRARRFCTHVTLYADRMDGALFYLEYLTKTSWTSPLTYSLGRRGAMLYRDLDPLDPPRTATLHQLAPSPEVFALALTDALKYPGVASVALNRRRPSTGDPLDVHTPRREYLDLDVIDTTWMDNNVHAIRHNYFNLNPTIVRAYIFFSSCEVERVWVLKRMLLWIKVEDLRHVIVDKQRARMRAGLLQTPTSDNVYIFRVAPSHVKNK
ncbi:hypothetical protein PsorP6_018026 [Peronosclerospora sorghi]|uniref:Uncharacterized protein n=1 Tax=Peronosclerospora sorghi TaxID=230839 RepID=A0ACC0WC21_9STRA|nr:hypothetical protein PsorP6_018026 [Peronosclerospora sorghi]